MTQIVKLFLLVLLHLPKQHRSVLEQQQLVHSALGHNRAASQIAPIDKSCLAPARDLLLLTTNRKNGRDFQHQPPLPSKLEILSKSVLAKRL